MTPATRDDWRALLRYCLVTECAVTGLLLVIVTTVRIAKAL